MKVIKEIHCDSKEAFLRILQELFNRGYNMDGRKETDEEYMWHEDHNYMHIWSDGSVSHDASTFDVHRADIQRFVDVDFLAMLDSESVTNDLIEIL